MPGSKSKSSNAGDDGNLRIEVQVHMSRCPSCSSTVADMGFTEKEAREEWYVEPDWVGKNCSAGSWEQPTRGHGDKEEEGEEDANKVQANGLSSQFGVLAANWGGKWGIKKEGDYMSDDIESSVRQLIVMQEVEPAF